jgi:hypothetical protein
MLWLTGAVSDGTLVAGNDRTRQVHPLPYHVSSRPLSHYALPAQQRRLDGVRRGIWPCGRQHLGMWRRWHLAMVGSQWHAAKPVAACCNSSVVAKLACFSNLSRSV